MHVPQQRHAAIRGAVQAQQKKSKTSRRRGYGASGGPQKANTRILAQQKRRTVLEMRKAGATFPAIAQALGYKDEGGAYKAYRKAMGEVITEPVAELKVLQQERLNHMLVAIWQRVQNGDIAAMNMALSIMNKMDALAGTESAQRIEVNAQTQQAVLVVDGSKDDYIAALKKMSGAGVGPDGQNLQPGTVAVAALPAGQQQPSRYPPGMEQSISTPVDGPGEEGDVVDAEVVEEEGGGVEVVAPAVPTQKQFAWGLDPTAKPRPKDQR